MEEPNTLLFDTKPRARTEAERTARKNHLEYYLTAASPIYLTRDDSQSGVDPARSGGTDQSAHQHRGAAAGLTLRQQPGGS